MTESIIVERVLDAPASEETVEEKFARAKWCLDLYGVHLIQSYLSADGRRMVCLFEAPDVESVRVANRKAGAQFQGVYAVTIHEPVGRDPVLAHVMVERSFETPADFDELQAIEDRGGWCLEMRQVSFLRTYFSKDRLRMLCLYDAPDAESVRIAQQKAGMPFDRVWTTTVIVPPAEN